MEQKNKCSPAVANKELPMAKKAIRAIEDSEGQRLRTQKRASLFPCNMINIITANIIDAAAFILSSGKLVSMS
jgi:hypothetical protein